MKSDEIIYSTGMVEASGASDDFDKISEIMNRLTESMREELRQVSHTTHEPYGLVVALHIIPKGMLLETSLVHKKHDNIKNHKEILRGAITNLVKALEDLEKEDPLWKETKSLH